MSRVRSPNFPVMSLPQAVSKIETIYDREQTLPAMRETIAEHLGYSGLNGASLKQISALGKYGLLEEVEGKGFRVSKLAMTILHPASSAERDGALRAAAKMPVLFQRLEEQFEGQRPSETNLRSWLLRNGFARSAVDNVVRVYSETMDLVATLGGASIAESAKADSEPTRVPSQHSKLVPAAVPHAGPSEPFSVEMLKGRVRVVGEVLNRQDAELLIKFLNSAMLFLPEKSESQHPHDVDDGPEDVLG